MLETLDYTIRIGSIPTFLYFDLYLYSAYAAHFVYRITYFVSRSVGVKVVSGIGVLVSFDGVGVTSSD